MPGEIFIDTLGDALKVVSIKELPWLGIERTHPKRKVRFITERGHDMFMNFRADRLVKLR